MKLAILSFISLIAAALAAPAPGPTLQVRKLVQIRRRMGLLTRTLYQPRQASSSAPNLSGGTVSGGAGWGRVGGCC